MRQPTDRSRKTSRKPAPIDRFAEGRTAAVDAHVEAMLDQVRDSPLDAPLAYELALALLRRGDDVDGLRYLDRSFRLDPLNIVRFVRSADLAALRTRDSIVALLVRAKREHDQRNYRGYA